MSLGSIWLKTRMTLGHGLRVAYWRDVVRPRILQTRPVVGNTDYSCELHVLSSEKDWMNLFWMLKSFYHITGRKYALCIHDDGSLGPEVAQLLSEHFPDSRLIMRQEADERLADVFAEFPRCREFRGLKENNLPLKVFDFFEYAKSERVMLVDSDVLFFSEPTELLRRIEDPTYLKNSVNADCTTAYALEPEALAEATGLKVEASYNSGLGLIHRESMSKAWVEEFLGIPGFREGHHWRIEQTLYALCSFRWGFEMLPEEYRVRIETGLEGLPSRHYVGEIRHLMYGEGVRRLVKSGFLEQIAQ